MAYVRVASQTYVLQHILYIYPCLGGEAAAAEQTGAWQLPRAGAGESSGGGAVLPGPALHSHHR